MSSTPSWPACSIKNCIEVSMRPRQEDCCKTGDNLDCRENTVSERPENVIKSPTTSSFHLSLGWRRTHLTHQLASEELRFWGALRTCLAQQPSLQPCTAKSAALQDQDHTVTV